MGFSLRGSKMDKYGKALQETEANQKVLFSLQEGLTAAEGQHIWKAYENEAEIARLLEKVCSVRDSIFRSIEDMDHRIERGSDGLQFVSGCGVLQSVALDLELAARSLEDANKNRKFYEDLLVVPTTLGDESE